MRKEHADHGEKTVRINLFDTIRIRLKDGAGKELPMDGGRDAVRKFTNPLLAKDKLLTIDLAAL